MGRKEATAFAFLDTNIFLQFKYFDQVDWTSELGYRQVCLVIAPIVLSELESFKYDRNSQRRCDRSRKVSQHLEQITNNSLPGQPTPIPGRADVTIIVLTDSPDMSRYTGLQHTVQDDQLLASILGFREAQSDSAPEDVILVSDDRGLLMKARARASSTSRLREGLQLADEPTEEQRELAALRKREPALKLAFSHGGQATESLAIDLVIVEDHLDDQIEELCRIEAEATLWISPGQRDSDSVEMGSQQMSQVRQHVAEIMQAVEETRRTVESMAYLVDNSISQEEIDRYEREREEYLDEYRTYLGESLGWERLRGRSQRIALVVNNDGTQPAVGVIVRVIVPDDITVRNPGNWLRSPTPPMRPVEPKSGRARMVASLQGGPGLMFSPAVFGARHSESGLLDPDQAGPSITPYNSTLVAWERSKVMHRLPLDLTPLILTFPAARGERMYELHYQLHAENLVNPAEGTLRIATRGDIRPFQPPPVPE